MVEVLKDPTSNTVADNVVARLVHSQGEAVENYDEHAEAFEPCGKG